jgi:cell division protein ZapA
LNAALDQIEQALGRLEAVVALRTAACAEGEATVELGLENPASQAEGQGGRRAATARSAAGAFPNEQRIAQIGGRPFTVACAEGEEAHLEMLGRMIDERVRGRSRRTERIADDALCRAVPGRRAARGAPQGASSCRGGPSAEARQRGRAVQALAERVEKLAQQIEQPS